MRSSSFLAAAGVAALAWTQVPEPAEPAAPTELATTTRIGYVDLQDALNGIEDGKRVMAELEAFSSERQTRLSEGVAAFQAEKIALDERQATLSPEALAREQAALEQKLAALQELSRELQSEVSSQEAMLMKPIFDRFASLLNAIGEEGGYALILAKTEDIVYASGDIELTDELVRRYAEQ